MPPDRKDMTVYLDTTRRTLWAWAEQHHGGQLDGVQRPRRPPVLMPEFADMNVLVPPDGSIVYEYVRPRVRVFINQVVCG